MNTFFKNLTYTLFRNNLEVITDCSFCNLTLYIQSISKSTGSILKTYPTSSISFLLHYYTLIKTTVIVYLDYGNTPISSAYF